MSQVGLPLSTVVVPQDERGFQRWIVEQARDRGWMVNHTYRAKLHDGTWRTTTTLRGMPDLTLFRPADGDRPGGVLFLEVKGAGVNQNRYPQQTAVISVLQRVGGNCAAWFVVPGDWRDVLAVLDGPPW